MMNIPRFTFWLDWLTYQLQDDGWRWSLARLLSQVLVCCLGREDTIGGVLMDPGATLYTIEWDVRGPPSRGARGSCTLTKRWWSGWLRWLSLCSYFEGKVEREDGAIPQYWSGVFYLKTISTGTTCFFLSQFYRYNVNNNRHHALLCRHHGSY